MLQTHSDRRKEQKELINLLSEYGVLELRQIYRYFQHKDESVMRRLLIYMVQNRFIVMDDQNRFAALTRAALQKGGDAKLIPCFWAMLAHPAIPEYHARQEYPYQLYFFSEGVEYDAFYIAAGDEALFNSVLNRKKNDARNLVVVEHPEQLEQIDIPNVEWFCTVDADGKIQRYVQEE